MIDGSLWLATRTRPDIDYQVGRAPRLVSHFPDEAVVETKTLLQYLVDTKDLSPIVVECRVCPCGWTDASFAPTGGKSPTGEKFQLLSVTMAWRASRTHLVVQSVAEAELVALQEGHILAAGIKEILSSLGLELGKVHLKTDNSAALALAHEGSSWRTRHFAVKAEGLRQQIAIEQIKVTHVPGTEQKADGLTKSLPKTLLDKFHHSLGMHPPGHRSIPPKCELTG